MFKRLCAEEIKKKLTFNYNSVQKIPNIAEQEIADGA